MAQQNLDFNIVAHTKGMEAIATLINRVGALEAETKRLASANQQLSASTDTVIRNGVRYNNAMDAQSRQLRQNRQGTQQLGMQINDFATSVSSGSSVTQAFTQQLGQVGFAMSMMGGTAGKIGSFLAGPWGAAVLIGAMALGPIIDKLFQSEEAAKKAADAHYKYLDAVAAGNMADLIRAEGELTKMQEKRLRLMDKVNAQRPGRIRATGGFGVGFGGAVDPTGDAKAQLERLNQEIAFQQIAIDAGNRAREQLNQNAKRISAGGNASSGSRTKKEDVENLSQVNIIERNQASIRESLMQTTKAWNDYWSEASGVATSAIETIANINTMAAASIETISEQSTSAFMARFQEVQQSFQTIGNSVASAFQGMLTGAMSWKDGMKGIIQSVINELWRLYVVQKIVGFVTKTLTGASYGGGGSFNAFGAATDIGNKLSSSTQFFGAMGTNANGTQNWRGGLSLVGERGPEIVNLPRGAQVIPAHRAQGMMGNGVTVNVDARGSADPAAVRAQVEAGILQAAPAIIAAAEARTVQGLRRPRLGGAMK